MACTIMLTVMRQLRRRDSGRKGEDSSATLLETLLTSDHYGLRDLSISPIASKSMMESNVQRRVVEVTVDVSARVQRENVASKFY